MLLDKLAFKGMLQLRRQLIHIFFHRCGLASFMQNRCTFALMPAQKQAPAGCGSLFGTGFQAAYFGVVVAGFGVVLRGAVEGAFGAGWVGWVGTPDFWL